MPTGSPGSVVTKLRDVDVLDGEHNVASRTDAALQQVADSLAEIDDRTTKFSSRPQAITDPGNGEAIPVTASGTLKISSGGAETRTLAAPTFEGQILTVILQVDGGNVVVTATPPVNQANNNTLTFADAQDTIRLEAVEVEPGTLEWRVVFNDGAVLSTV